MPFTTSVSNLIIAGRRTDTPSCEEDDWLVQIRPGCPGSKPSVGDTLRRGYGKLSFVVKIREVEMLFVERNFEDVVLRESVVSGPERVNGEETLRVRVYGGP